MTDLPLSAPDDDTPFDLETEPLDRPTAFETDWGGDGSDLHRPVRAHVLAALRPNTAPYPPPVDELLRLGDPGTDGVDERRSELGLGQEHLPDLLRMARDRALYSAKGDSLEVWGPLHAVRVLSDLDLSNDVAELIPLFDLQDDWYSTELPELMGKVGAPALEPLRDYLADRSRWGYGHASASDALSKIPGHYPELRAPVVAILSDVLRDAEHYYDDVATTGAMGALVDLDAIEALPLIRHAFEIGKIDEMMYGPWGAILNKLGVEAEADDPLMTESQRRFEDRQENISPGIKRSELLESLDRFRQQTAQRKKAEDQLRAAQAAARLRDRKQKNKRKQQSAARKANRKKR